MSDFETTAEFECKAIPFEVKVAGKAGPGPDASHVLEGIGGAFNNLDGTGDIIAPGAFADSLEEFLKTGVVGGLNHNWDAPIGHPIEARETPEGLYVKAVLDDSPEAAATLARMKVNPASGRATIRRLSIGYKALDHERLASPEAVKAYWGTKAYAPTAGEIGRLDAAFTPRFDPTTGKNRTPGVRLLKKLSLYEVSPVTVPANDRAMILSAKMYGGPMGMGGYAEPGRPTGDLDDATDRVRDCIVGIFLDYLCMSLRFVVANDMVAPDDRLAIVGQTIDQTRDALLQHLRPILAADDSDDAAEDIAETLGDMSKQLKARLDLPGFDTKDFALVPGADFASHSRVVVSANEVDLAAVAAFVQRAESRSEARFKVGRELSQANIDEIDSVADSIEAMARGHLEHAGRLRTLTGKAKGKSAPVEPAFPAVPAAAGITPILMGGKSAVPASGSDAEPASPAGPNLSDYLAQFYATDPALTGIDVARP